MTDQADRQAKPGKWWMAAAIVLGGCATSQTTPIAMTAAPQFTTTGLSAAAVVPSPAKEEKVAPATRQVAHLERLPQEEIVVAREPDLQELINLAQAANPSIRRLEQQTQAAWARVPQQRSLPDPMVGGTVYGEPMVMGEDHEQRGSLMISQTLPWLKRLDAAAQQAAYEALAARQTAQAMRLQIKADVATQWYQLYLLNQQIQINEANQQLLRSLLEVATARVRVGDVTQSDVLLATLELSRLEEELLLLRQQSPAAQGTLNQLLNRPAGTPIVLPETIAVREPAWSLEELLAYAREYQPQIQAAQLQTAASSWGLRVAQLRQVPDLTVSYEYMFMGPTEGGDPAHAGPDSWLLGASVNVPLWRKRYLGIQEEASREHYAAHASFEEVVRANEATLVNWLEQARAAHRTLELYEQTILPQARQSVAVSREAYAQGRVDFDRVIADVRSLLALETSYHRARASLATATARLEQTVGMELPIGPSTEAIAPPAGRR